MFGVLDIWFWRSSQNVFWLSLVAEWWQNGNFLFHSPSVFMFVNLGLWRKEYLPECWRQNGIFAKNSRRDASRQNAQLWNSQSPECRDASQNIDFRALVTLPRDQNDGRARDEAICVGDTQWKAALWSTKHLVARLHIRPHGCQMKVSVKSPTVLKWGQKKTKPIV